MCVHSVCGCTARCARRPAAPRVPLTVFLFPMDELRRVVMKSNCFKHRVMVKLHSLNIPALSLPLTRSRVTCRYGRTQLSRDYCITLVPNVVRCPRVSAVCRPHRVDKGSENTLFNLQVTEWSHLYVMLLIRKMIPALICHSTSLAFYSFLQALVWEGLWTVWTLQALILLYFLLLIRMI